MNFNNRKIAFLFPGQGAQYEQMGAELIENSPVYALAEKILDEKVFSVIKEGRLEDLEKTKYCQIGIFLNCLALYFELKKNALQEELTFDEAVEKSITEAKPAMIGLSLGEYTALCGSGKLSLAEGISIVEQRGKIMAEGVKGKGSMVAVMRPDLKLIQELVSKAKTAFGDEEVLAVCNYNSPQQIVVGGTFKVLEEFENLCKEFGVRKTVRVKVDGPFHTEVLKAPAQKFGEILQKVSYDNGYANIYSNVDGKVYGEMESKEEIIKKLKKQMYSPVRFQTCIQEAIKDGYNTFIEIGPGKTLSSFVKKIDKTVDILNVEKLKDVSDVLTKLKDEA